MSKIRDSHTSTRYAVMLGDTVLAVFNTRDTAIAHKTMLNMLTKDMLEFEIGTLK